MYRAHPARANKKDLPAVGIAPGPKSLVTTGMGSLRQIPKRNRDVDGATYNYSLFNKQLYHG